MNEGQSAVIHLTPQEAWFQRASTPDASSSEAHENLYAISSLAVLESGARSGYKTDFTIDDQKRLREGGIFVPLSEDLQYGFPYWSKFTLQEGEVAAIKLQEIDASGKTMSDPEFAIVKLDERERKYIPIEDEARGIDVSKVTEAFYSHYKEAGTETYLRNKEGNQDPEGNSGTSAESKA